MSKKRLFIDSNGYPCAPVNVKNDLWFYIERAGLHIVTHPGGTRGHISWATIRKALDDHNKASTRTKRARHQ